jgi:hypothetical protein
MEMENFKVMKIGSKTVKIESDDKELLNKITNFIEKEVKVRLSRKEYEEYVRKLKDDADRRLRLLRAMPTLTVLDGNSKLKKVLEEHWREEYEKEIQQKLEKIEVVD